jgi:1-acyl-sn-glycerol-3-phosphate acyltransferase
VGILALYRLACIRAIKVRFQAELPEGPIIIAPNHPNATDAFVLPSVFPGKLSCAVQADVFDVPVFGRLLAWTGAVPVVRGQSATVLTDAQIRLEQGRSVVIFPEGRLNHGGAMYRLHTGTVRLALSSGAPIVPMAFYTPARFCRMFYGRFQDKPRSGRFQFGGPIFLEIGTAWWPAGELAGPPGPESCRQLTDRLAGRIAALVSQAAGRAESLPAAEVS